MLNDKQRMQARTIAEEQVIFIATRDYDRYENGDAIRDADFEYLFRLQRAACDGTPVWGATNG